MVSVESPDEKARAEGSKHVAGDKVIVTPTEALYTDDENAALDPVYALKAGILNDALSEIGMGRYQWAVFCVTGFGWFATQLWSTVTALILTQVVNEFGSKAPWLNLGQNSGLLVGVVFWGVGSDVWGRTPSFNITLLIAGVFAVAGGASPTYVALCALAACWSVGVGGNWPVDSAIFLEFVPREGQYLLTILSVWWPLGQLAASLIAWPLLGSVHFSCPTGTAADPLPCPKESNMGWRYLLYTTGGLMLVLWFVRFAIFNLWESPKYLMGRGRDAEAVDIIHKVAAYNKATSSLTLEILENVGRLEGHSDEERALRKDGHDTSALGAIRRNLSKLSSSHLRRLFATRRLALSTSLLCVIWGLIGLAFPLYNNFVPYYLATRGADFGDGSVYITYRNQVIISVIGVPGVLLAGWMVELPYLGRRGTLAISTVLTGVFILVSTTARTSNALLGWNCGYSFTSNVMYGVLDALSPEVFPTKDRGTGNGLVGGVNALFGVMAPIVALYANLTSSVPIFIAGALFLLSGFVALVLPFEPRGRTSL